MLQVKWGVFVEERLQEMSADEETKGADRRGAPRRRAQCEARLLFIASVEPVEETQAHIKLFGHTRDLSETGLSLVADTIHITDFELCSVGSRLKVKLSLPSGVVEMDATVVRREWLNENDPREGYFMGVSIMEMKTDDRTRLSEFLGTLK